ncbi:phage tail protein [Novosphingobium sp. PY1]|uniref:TipJ family phage tail tip protein n=1 Tax=Novosphingobium sp. PY1 TaxID=1882221 RepID=UPI001A8EAC3C|nr:phage tail protein [Novosphingobium sp. PY1]GFM27165.1 phage-related protein tail component-like protei n [Novosphingobium sp. PY1]
MQIKVQLHGAFKDRMPKGHKKPKTFYVNRIKDVFDFLEQYYPIKQQLDITPAMVRVGPTLAKSSSLSREQLHEWFVPDGAVIHIAPFVSGHEITSAMLITALVSTAVSIGISLLMSLLFPPTQTKNDKRKSALYENGLNTNEEGVVLPYVAGDEVLCGFNVIETDVDITNSGGGAGSSGFRGLMERKSGALIDATTGVSNNDGTSVYDPSEGGYIAEVVQGEKGGGKTIANTTFSDATLRILAAYGAGETGGIVGSTWEEKEKNILVNEVPLRDRGTGARNYKGFSWTERRGIEGQTASPITPGVTSVFDASVDLTKLNSGGSQVYVTNSVTDNQVNRVKIRIRYNALLRTTKKGNQKTTDCSVGAEVKRVNDTVWTPAGTWRIQEKSSDPFDREYELAAPEGYKDDAQGWMFRVYRITPDSTDDKLQNDTAFRGWVEIQDRELAYDGSGGEVPTALFGAAIDLAQFDANSWPEIALICRGQKVRVPDNYNPVTRTYTGAWSGAWSYAVTKNPVWHWYELATNVAMACGLPETFFSPISLYQAAQYCDQDVNGRPRFTLNKQFVDEKEGWSALKELAQTFRAWPHHAGSQIILAQDRPQSAVDHFVNNAVIKDGLFRYKSTNIQERVNETIVEYDNMDDYGRKALVIYRDDAAIATNRALGLSNNGVVSNRVYKIGCTNKQEAYDYARILTFISQNEHETVEFDTMLAGAAYAPGQLIEVHDWNVSGLAPTGRVLEVTPTHAKMDNAITLKANTSYNARIYIGDNAMTVRPVLVQSIDTITNQVPFDTTDLEAGTPISIVEVGSEAIQPRTFRIIDIKENGPSQYTVTAQLHIEGKYAWLDDNVPVADIPWSQIPTAIPKPTGLKASNNSWIDDLTGIHHEINLSWDAVNVLPVGENVGQITPINGYVVEVLRPFTSAWERIYQGHNTFCTLDDAQPGTYTFSVRAINILNRSGEAALLTHEFSYGAGEEGTLLPPIFVGLNQ